ncbi:MAG: hypothetical protein SFU25_09235 [Candidatus Caenarcaniphilales bacterium]|nr:hypothetical protein [Candidatus Caenarcaniphilales bacterium]
MNNIDVKTFLFGDTYLERLNNSYKSLCPEYESWGIKGLPVFDVTSREMLEKYCQENDLVIWFCSTWFNGIAEYGRLKERLENSELEEKDKLFIFFHNPEKRYGFASLTENKTTRQEREFMKDHYLHVIEYLLQKHPNLYLCPLTLFFYETILSSFFPDENGFEEKFSEIFKDRIVPSGPFDLTHLEDYKGNFNENGYKKLLENIKEFTKLFE